MWAVRWVATAVPGQRFVIKRSLKGHVMQMKSVFFGKLITETSDSSDWNLWPSTSLKTLTIATVCFRLPRLLFATYSSLRRLSHYWGSGICYFPDGVSPFESFLLFGLIIFIQVRVNMISPYYWTAPWSTNNLSINHQLFQITALFFSDRNTVLFDMQLYELVYLNPSNSRLCW